MAQNPNCCGGNCCTDHGEVRVYPLGGGANLILCKCCWAHENRYRYERQADYLRKAQKDDRGTRRGLDSLREHHQKVAAENWPQLNWSTAEVYQT